eukprot:4964443-Pleurochrysis_carterae.AAC.2
MFVAPDAKLCALTMCSSMSALALSRARACAACSCSKAERERARAVNGCVGGQRGVRGRAVSEPARNTARTFCENGRGRVCDRRKRLRERTFLCVRVQARTRVRLRRKRARSRVRGDPRFALARPGEFVPAPSRPSVRAQI